MAHIKGNGGGKGGRNESYTIGNRKAVPRPQAVSEVKSGMHPGYHTIKVNRREYVRDTRDGSKNDNVNR